MAKRPTTGRPPRLPCATAARIAPHLSPDSFSVEGFRAIARIENKSLVTINESKNRSLTLYVLAINVQRGNRIIVIDSIFATPFSDVFSVQVKRGNSCCDRGQCDHLSCVLRVVCVSKFRYASDPKLCFCCDERNCELLDFLRKRECKSEIKKRSPYVSR